MRSEYALSYFQKLIESVYFTILKAFSKDLFS